LQPLLEIWRRSEERVYLAFGDRDEDLPQEDL
jgi:hypothetical protein